MTELTKKLMSEKFAGEEAVASEIINLEAILRLPKGTEHFLSDLHGEYEAFCHLMNNCSGVIREKVENLFGKFLSEDEQCELATSIYYPKEKIAEKKAKGEKMEGWYKTALYRMTEVARELSKKYTRSKVRKAMPKYFAYIIDEMLYSASDSSDKAGYYNEIFSEIIQLDMADGFVESLAGLIKRLAIDHLHIVGDVFDRGEHPEKIMDMLIRHHSIDFQWGNHDILWMGAAAGSAVCVATVIELCLKYSNVELLEIGYGISLRELAFFADRLSYDPKFAPKQWEGKLSESDKIIVAKMRKAIFHIMLKLEGEVIDRRPEYGMENRAILRHINCHNATVNIDGESVPIIDPDDFNYMKPKDSACIDDNNPNALTQDEERVKDFLIKSFTGSEKLRRHFNFLIDKGAFYTVFNGNLIFHGCIPLDERGDFLRVKVGGQTVSGKACLDRYDHLVRFAAKSKNPIDKDIFWYLWCGSNSPLFGRKKLANFESVYVADHKFSKEEKNYYYTLSRKVEIAEKILAEFGLTCTNCHIINGHIPVEYIKGENPIKAGGKLVVIDGGFCRAYHSRTGIAGYTLIYNSQGMRLAAHSPFKGKTDAIQNNSDIISDINIFETAKSRLKVGDCDNGVKIKEQIDELKELLRDIRDKYNI